MIGKRAFNRHLAWFLLVAGAGITASIVRIAGPRMPASDLAMAVLIGYAFGQFEGARRWAYLWLALALIIVMAGCHYFGR
jgi:hypothetical protein